MQKKPIIIVSIILSSVLLAGLAIIFVFQSPLYNKDISVVESKVVNAADTLSLPDYLKEFLDVYNSVSSEYYKEIDKKAMLEEAINAMMDYLGDEYSSYLNEDETSLLSKTLSGKYKGIGVSFKDKTIVSVFKNSPAELAGLKENDIIVKVNNKDCASLDDNEIVNLIKEKTK